MPLLHRSTKDNGQKSKYFIIFFGFGVYFHLVVRVRVENLDFEESERRLEKVTENRPAIQL